MSEELAHNFPPETRKPVVGVEPRLRQQALQDFTIARSKMPFEWGVNDCALCAADWVKICTGIDYAAAFRGYTGAREALSLISTHGGLQAIATAALGEPVASGFETVGDVVLIDFDGNEVLGICNGATTLGPGPNGLVAVTFPVLAAWRF